MKDAIQVNKRVETVTHYEVKEEKYPVKVPEVEFVKKKVMEPYFEKYKVREPYFEKYKVDEPFFVKKEIEHKYEKLVPYERKVPFDCPKPNFIHKDVFDVNVIERKKYVTSLFCEHCKKEVK